MRMAETLALIPDVDSLTPARSALDGRRFSLSMNLPSARGIYAASLIASRATLKRHEGA